MYNIIVNLLWSALTLKYSRNSVRYPMISDVVILHKSHKKDFTYPIHNIFFVSETFSEIPPTTK